jgi:hypothetical protein
LTTGRVAAVAGWHLLGELARAREDRLDVGGRRLLAANLGHIDAVVHWEGDLVRRPERTQVEPRPALVVLGIKALRRKREGTSSLLWRHGSCRVAILGPWQGSSR